MTDAQKGLWAMIGACVSWGLSPILFKALTGVPPTEVLAHRTLWSVVIFAAVLAVQGRLATLWDLLHDRRRVLYVLAAATCIFGGWFLFIWAIQTGRTTQTALGFYIFPLVAVLFGRMFFADRLTMLQGVAVGMVALAVLVLTAGLGTLPWVALVLAISFGIYGLIKKRLGAGPVVSVTAEVLVLSPLALWLLWQSGAGAMMRFVDFGPPALLLILSGPVTAIPLILFSYATSKLTMTSSGLISYINPTLQFFCAVILFGEPFTLWHGVAFALIWGALALYSVTIWRQERARLSAVKTASASGTAVM